MNFNSIIKDLGTLDNNNGQGDRRSALKSFGAKLAVAAIPVGLYSLTSNKASAQSRVTIINKLNYLLKFEQVTAHLYEQAAVTTGLIPEKYTEQFNKVRAYNAAHTKTLSDIITELGGTVITANPQDIDLSGGNGNGTGPFNKVLTDFADFLVLAQMLADLNGRVYKNSILAVLSDNETTRSLANINSVHSRLSVFIRSVREATGNTLKPWITAAKTDTDNTAVQRAYNGEAMTSQSNISIVGINGFDINADRATEAFDEPMEDPDGNNIIDRFFK